MASFAQRIGKRPVRSLIQREGLDDETRTEIWNVTVALVKILHEKERSIYNEQSVRENVVQAVWAWSLKQRRDEQPREDRVWSEVKRLVIQGEWFDALDVIESVTGYVKRYEDFTTQGVTDAIIDAYNHVFEQYLVGYRFVGQTLVPLESQQEAEAVSAAIGDAQKFKGARHHLERATALLADRRRPDAPNAVKEAISAVESVCREVTGQKTLGDALKRLQAAGVKIHPALERAWSSMYGWTSDADGIRHGSFEAPDVDLPLAKYMLVTCSAFVSHVIEVGRKAKLV